MKSLFEAMFANQNYKREPWNTDYGTQPGPIVGSPTSFGGPNLPQSPSNLYSTDEIEVGHCNNLHGWQQQLVGMLANSETNKKDIYILSQPGSGKTEPVMCYWVNNILGIKTSMVTPSPTDLANFSDNIALDESVINLFLHPEKIGKVLWLVPIRNLSVNINEDVQEKFLTAIMLQILNRQVTFTPDGDMKFSTSMEKIIRGMAEFGNASYTRLLFDILRNQTVAGQLPSRLVPEFKTTLGQLVIDYIKRALIGRIQEGINTCEIGNTGNYKPFIISIYESSKHLISHLDNLKLIIFDEAQRVQGGDEKDDKRAAQIGDGVHTILMHQNGRNARIVMLSGSASPDTAKNVMHYFNMSYKRNFETRPFETPKTVTNPSNIVVRPMSGLNDQHTQLLLVNTWLAQGKDGIVFIIFSKEKINKIIDKLASSERGVINPGQNFSTERQIISHKKGSLYNKKDASMITNPGTINEISDERLRRAASNGLGFLYRPEELVPAREKDTAIVQRLFKNGIIKILFATDAVREGMNITCKEMYIPSILLPPDNREMDSGSLTQLINRAGRESGKLAAIYTDSKFVNNITRALSNEPSNFGEQPFTLPKSKWKKAQAITNYGIGIGKDIAIRTGKEIMKMFS